jgi:hypothetical protein
VILGFHTKQLRERGTEVAIFDYALGAQAVLGHEVRIFVPAGSPRIVESVKDHFSRAFEVVLYDDPDSISCDALYVIKKGTYSRVTTALPELNHAFSDGSQPHGHRFAVVSEWLARRSARRVGLPGGRTMTVPGMRRPQAVPHIVSLPETIEDLRTAVGIPDDAVVFGRHGGDATFDLDFVHSAIRRALGERNDIWFLFLNTDRFLDHERIVHLPAFADRADVRRFVNSCDYMLHANAVGETFGLAVAEFAFVGAPVLTFLGSPQLAHLDLLTDGLLVGYKGFEDLFRQLMTLERRETTVRSRVAENYSVERVMTRFDEVFLRS